MKFKVYSQYGERFPGFGPKQVIPDVVAVSQEFKDDCDPNVIISRFMTTGHLPAGRDVAPLEGDLSDIQDFDVAMNTVARGQAAFDALPSKIRARFHNDPSEFITFVSDEENKAEAIALGLRAADPIQADPAPQGGQQAVPAAGEGPKA